MRVALVTGAAGGIGRATVDRLFRQGYGLIALDIDSDVEHLEGDLVVPVVGDVRDRAALDSAVETAIERFGRLDVAVAGAAVIGGGSALWDTEPQLLDELLDVDVRGVWNTAAVAIPAMLSGPDPSGCRFVAIASSAAHSGMFGLSAYGVAKHGVVGLVRGLAADLVGTGVTAAAVSPGATRTPMLSATAELYGVVDVEDFAAHQLVRRILEPDEIAAAIAFCCSIEGAALNGSTVRADGGFS